MNETMKKKSQGLLSFLKNKGKLWVLLCGAFLGIVLLIVGNIGKSGTQTESTDNNFSGAAETEIYAQQLEKKLETLCEAVAGVSDVTVTVSFSRGYLVSYVTDSAGNPVTTGSGSNKSAVISTVSLPEISGVGVVCRGGGNPFIQKTLTELLSATLSIPSNRIFVTGK